MSATEIWLRLMAVYGLNGENMLATANFLLAAGDCKASTLIAAGLPPQQVKQFIHVSGKTLEASFRWLEQTGCQLLTVKSENYPETLRAIASFPAALFVQGNISELAQPQLAVVGSRNLSHYGERWCRIFCYALAKAGLAITSGLALGIDAVAHKAALQAGGTTIAVLGNGLQHIYPKRHYALAQQIVEQGGVLVSEFPLSCNAWPANFPRRNRIISGLSRGVFVVEAGERSGSLVTARFAIEQGRELFALPGAVGSPGSEGPHWLIKQGATLVSHPADIIEYFNNELQWLSFSPKSEIYYHGESEHALPFPGLLDNVGDEVTPVDVVAKRVGQPVPETAAQLLELELAGWIAAVPGGYVRLRRACHVRRTNVFI